jgi:hypothetical protein
MIGLPDRDWANDHMRENRRRNLLIFSRTLKNPTIIAKVGVEGSNPFARSRFSQYINYLHVSSLGVPKGLAGLFGVLFGHQLGKGFMPERRLDKHQTAWNLISWHR